MILYTDIDEGCCAVLEERVNDGDLPRGDVLRADVRELGTELDDFDQVHLFAGIGGSPLGFHWAGWPAEWSLVTGGFPCQQVSSAGKGEGIGTRENPTSKSGLFWELCRVVERKKPMGVLAENVGALSARGLDRVAGALESLGYWVEALRVGSWSIGCPDRRERWWFVCRRIACSELGNVHGARLLNHGETPSESGGDGTQGRELSIQAGERGNVADQRVRGQGAERLGGAGAVTDQPVAGVDLGHVNGSGRGQHEPGRRPQGRGVAGRPGASGRVADLNGAEPRDAEAGRRHRETGVVAGADPERRVANVDGCGLRTSENGRTWCSQPTRASEPSRWPHPRWFVIDEEGRERTVPTPQHDWEPPRLFPGTRTVNARWRLALMGYPLHWLDLSPSRMAAATAGKRHHDRAWNKKGVEMTGNAQNARVVAALARGMIDSVYEAGGEPRRPTCLPRSQ